MPKCRCGGIGRRPGLKIPWENIPYRFDPGHRHQVHIAEWSNPVARRAHNPKVVGSNPASATKNNSIVDTISAMEFYFLALKPLILMVFRVFFFYKHEIRHPLPRQGQSGGYAIVQVV